MQDRKVTKSNASDPLLGMQGQTEDKQEEQGNTLTVIVPNDAAAQKIADTVQQVAATVENQNVTITYEKSPDKEYAYIFKIKLESADQNNYPRTTQLLKVILGSISVLAAYFYWNYSKDCAEDEQCGKPIFFTDDPYVRRWVLAISGGMGFAGTNLYVALLTASSVVNFFVNNNFLKATAVVLPYITLQVTTMIFAV